MRSVANVSLSAEQRTVRTTDRSRRHWVHRGDADERRSIQSDTIIVLRFTGPPVPITARVRAQHPRDPYS
eukprot:1176151-Prorocentrum_minimum.AAC.4